MLLSEFSKMSEAEKAEAVASLVAEARKPADGRLDSFRAEILDLEEKHGMTTDEMKAGFVAGTVPDDYVFVRWLMLARVVGGPSSSSRTQSSQPVSADSRYGS